MATKDLIIGAASGYDWNKLKYWVNSIKKTGFTGDIVVVATNISKETIEKLVSEGVKLSLYGTQNANGSFSSPVGIVAPHVERFFHIWHTLESLEEEDYWNIIVTDTRDVVFQRNPTEWLDDRVDAAGDSLIVSSEGLGYQDEPWGRDNFNQTFGPFFYERIKDRLIHNVGVIAGTYDRVKALMMSIFQMSINRPIPIVDQAVYNFLLEFTESKHTGFTMNNEGWAIQLGTTYDAVAAGKGDLGAAGLDAYQDKYVDDQPFIDSLGLVFPAEFDCAPFCIVHQWDRVPELAKKIEELYG